MLIFPAKPAHPGLPWRFKRWKPELLHHGSCRHFSWRLLVSDGNQGLVVDGFNEAVA